MKVLTFCAYYNPEIAASMYITENLFEALADNGISVIAYAPTPTRGIDRETIKKYKKIKYEEAYGGFFKLHRFSMVQEGENTVLRALRYTLVCLAFLFKGLFTKADIMFIDSTPPIQGIIAGILRFFKKIPVVYNVQDVFPDSLVNTGMTKQGSFIWKIGRLVEKLTYRNSDKIVVISEDFKNNLLAKGVPEEKISVILNWVDENAVKSIARESNTLFDEFELDRNKFYICYSGNVGHTQNMDMLLDVAKELSYIKDISFIIVGDGAYKQQVTERVKSENIENIILLPFQPYEKISEVFSLGDVGLIISKAGVGTNSVPSKTWSIMSAERPVLASFDKGSELDRIITGNKCGICIQPDNPQELKTAVIDLYENHNKLEEMGKNGREFILRELTKEIGTQKWVNLIKGFEQETANEDI